MLSLWYFAVYTSRSGWNGWHIADDILKYIFLKENHCVFNLRLLRSSILYPSLMFHSKFAPMCPIINSSIFDLVMAWCRHWQATSHYRIRCLSTSPMPTGNGTTPQRVKVIFYGIQSGFGRYWILQWFDAWFATNLSSIPIMNESSS